VTADACRTGQGAWREEVSEPVQQLLAVRRVPDEAGEGWN